MIIHLSTSTEILLGNLAAELHLSPEIFAARLLDGAARQMDEERHTQFWPSKGDFQRVRCGLADCFEKDKPEPITPGYGS